MMSENINNRSVMMMKSLAWADRVTEDEFSTFFDPEEIRWENYNSIRFFSEGLMMCPCVRHQSACAAAFNFSFRSDSKVLT